MILSVVWRPMSAILAWSRGCYVRLLQLWLSVPLYLLSMLCSLVLTLAGRRQSDFEKEEQAAGVWDLASCIVPESIAQRRLGLGLSRIWRTVEIAFENSSYWRALVLLDIWAWLAVWRTHEASHADAMNAAVVEEAAPEALSSSRREAVSSHLLRDAAVAALHSKAAYGHLAARGCVDSWQGFLQLLTVKALGKEAVRRITPEQHERAVGMLTGVERCDIIAARWRSNLHQPAYYICLDRSFQCIVLSVRGTVQMGDYLTVLDAAPEPITLAGASGHAHAGMLASAHAMLDDVLAALQRASASAPGWPILLTGHSLGGGVAALLTLMLEELRLRGDARMQALGPARSISIGTAAATCQQLGEACRDRVTSVVYGADALPMFSIRGARMLIDDVNSSSRVAALVSRVVSRRERAAAQLERGVGMPAPGAAAAAVATAAAGVEAAAGTALNTRANAIGASAGPCSIVCGAVCSGLCGAPALDSAWELQHRGAELGTASAATGTGSSGSGRDKAAVVAAAAAESLHERSPSVSSDWSDWSSAASVEGAGEGGVTMYPPGRILWVLPAGSKASGIAQPSNSQQQQTGRQQQQQRRRRQQQQQQHGDGPHVVVAADQSLFRRFLLLPSTALHHVPQTYVRALQGLLRATSSLA